MSRLLANAISNLKNELIDPAAAVANLTDDSGELSRTVASVYGEYQRRLRAANALDFDDLIGETVAVLVFAVDACHGAGQLVGIVGEVGDRRGCWPTRSPT
ncbi:hypothetical protein MAHJHV59_47310 [Mycobacterium avium subsp. hominissuis]